MERYVLYSNKLSNSQSDFEKVGFKFGSSSTYFEIPDKWTMGEPDEQEACFIFDNHGRKRAKYSQNDKSRYELALLCRYTLSYELIQENIVEPKGDVYLKIVVMDCDGLKVYETSAFKASFHEDYSIEFSMLNEWMNERYPFWQNPTYYWTY